MPMKTTKNVPAKNKKKAIILTTLAVGAAGVLGYFGWQYYKKKKEKKADIPESANEPEQPESITYKPQPVKVKKTKPVFNYPKPPVYIPPASTVFNTSAPPVDEFPIRRGSKGEKVRMLQQALIDKYGRQILPRYGADGSFGAEMATALKKLKLPAAISQSTYNVLVQTSDSDNTSLAQSLFRAASKRDFTTTLSLLKRISSADEYREVSNQFKTYYLNGVRQTLVNGMLNSFTTTEQKQAIRFEFIRMGLQYDGSKWSLSGFSGKPIITTLPTTVWVNAKQGVNVSSRTVLGNEVSRRLGYSLFENKGKYFLVHTTAIKYL